MIASPGTSLKAEDDDFTREIAISTPESKSDAFVFEDGDDFIGEVVFPTPKIGSDEKISRKRSVTFKDDDDDDDDDDMSDPDEANYWYADLSNFDAARSAFDGKNVNSLTLHDVGVKFYQFAFLAMLMQLFESWLLPDQQWHTPRTMLKSGSDVGNGEKKEFRTMTTRKFQFADEKFEVIGLGFGGSFD
jgi:hypothetical protein